MCTTTMVHAVRTNLNPKAPSRGGGDRAARLQIPARPPLIPSESDNALAPAPPRRSKSRDVSSRYMSSSSSSSSPSPSLSASRRCPSPIVTRRTPALSKVASTPAATPTTRPVLKRAQSAERRRPVTPVAKGSDSRNWSGGGEAVTSAQKMLFTSTRSLSVSFQGDSFSFQVSKAKPTPSSAASSLNLRRSTPERRKATAVSENSKPIEQHRWPARSIEPSCATRSLSFDDERRIGGFGSGGNVVGVNSSAIGSESVSDDSESISSGGSCPGLGQRFHSGIVMPVRFREEAYSPAAAAKSFATPSNLIAFPKKLSIDSSMSTPRGAMNSRGQASPLRGGPYRPASPSRAAMTAASTPARGISPSRGRSLVPASPSSGNYVCSTPSIMSFAAEARRGKMAESRIQDAQVLRLLHNRLFQWRFANASSELALSAQKLNAETSLYNAWVSTTKLRESVKAKRTELQFMRQNLKLVSILKGQMKYLEEWSLVDQAYTGALSGAIESLRASTLRLPVIDGARAEIQDIKDAICSAVDVLQAMVSPISLLSSKVEEVNFCVSELSNLTAKERALLGQCKSFLSTITALQVKECSIQTQVIQLTRMQT